MPVSEGCSATVSGLAARTLAQKHDLAFVRRNQTENQLDDGGFACAVMSGQTHALPCLQYQIDLVDGTLFAETLSNVSQLDVVGAHECFLVYGLFFQTAPAGLQAV